jgi:hypothetical protein
MIKRESNHGKPSRAVVAGLTFGALIAVPALWLTYAYPPYACYLFPVPLCLAGETGGIGIVSITLACLQFPAYGAALAFSSKVSLLALAVVVLVIAHLHVLPLVLFGDVGHM